MSGDFIPLGNRANSFTLVELMVAMAVFILLMAIFMQMMAQASRSWRDGQQRVDNYARARATLDLIAREIQSGEFRSDLPNFVNESGDYSLAFYTRRPGMTTNEQDNAELRPLTLVSYSHNTNAAELERQDIPMLWPDDPTDNLNFGSVQTMPAYANLGEPLSLTDGIIAFRITFRQRSGEVVSQYQVPANANEEVQAIGISLAVVDTQTELLLKRQQKWTSLMQLPIWNQTTLPSRQTLMGYWTDQIYRQALSGASTGGLLTPQIAQKIQVFERFVWLPAPLSTNAAPG